MTGAGAGSAESAPQHPRWLRPLALAVGLALLVAAVAAVVRQRDVIGDALAAVGHPSPGAVALLLVAVAANVALTGLVFSILMARHGRVELLEMQALLAGATLLNFLPLRPGLFGRVAYHRAFNAIPATASVKTVVEAMVLSLAVACYLVVVLVICGRGALPLWAGLGLPVPLLAGAVLWPRLRRLAAAGLVRYLEVGVWAARYAAAFALLGSPIEMASALAFACIACITMLVPLVGNGLGVREWATGAAAPLLTCYVVPLGLAAELVNRAGELLMVTLLGSAGLAHLAWRRRR